MLEKPTQIDGPTSLLPKPQPTLDCGSHINYGLSLLKPLPTWDKHLINDKPLPTWDCGLSSLLKPLPKWDCGLYLNYEPLPTWNCGLSSLPLPTWDCGLRGFCVPLSTLIQCSTVKEMQMARQRTLHYTEKTEQKPKEMEKPSKGEKKEETPSVKEIHQKAEYHKPFRGSIKTGITSIGEKYYYEKDKKHGNYEVYKERAGSVKPHVGTVPKEGGPLNTAENVDGRTIKL